MIASDRDDMKKIQDEIDSMVSFFLSFCFSLDFSFRW
jgi:hypothetical protein